MQRLTIGIPAIVLPIASLGGLVFLLSLITLGTKLISREASMIGIVIKLIDVMINRKHSCSGNGYVIGWA